MLKYDLLMKPDPSRTFRLFPDPPLQMIRDVCSHTERDDNGNCTRCGSPSLPLPLTGREQEEKVHGSDASPGSGLPSRVESRDG